MKLVTSFFALALLLNSTVAFAQSQVMATVPAYQNHISVGPIDVLVPTVVEVPIDDGVFTSNQFLVYERGNNKFIGSYFKRLYSPEEIAMRALTNIIVPNSQLLVDRNTDTTVDFDLPETGPGSVTISLSTPQSITASELRFNLAPHVSYPEKVSIKAQTDNGARIIVAPKPVDGSAVSFPETTARQFEVTFSYAQPLRMSEITLVQKPVRGEYNQSLRFLAQPQASYDIYFNPDRSVIGAGVESGNLRSDEGVEYLISQPTGFNSRYVPADVDSDSIRDTFDNCVNMANPDQADINDNGRGDACEDYDKDGIMNNVDNCPDQPNQYQTDTDGDGLGDACDQEESRFTERNPWVPWVGMGLAVVVLGVLFALVATGPKRRGEEGVPANEEDPVSSDQSNTV